MTKVQIAIIELLEAGNSVTQSLQPSGTTRKQFYQWLKDDEEFRTAIMHSDLADIITIEDVLFVKAMSGSAQDRKLYFERRDMKTERTEPPSWVEKQLATLKKWH
jgi:hypothetical protein